MISLSNTSAQTVAVGQAITFDTVVQKTGCAESYRVGTGQVRLRANNGIYEVAFSANVTGSTAGSPVQLAVAISGATMPETTMISTPATADAVNNISTTTSVRNDCGDYDRVTIVNTGTIPVIVSANPVLFIKRIA